MAAKTLKVKDLAGKYGLSPKDIVKELQEQGYESITGASSAIPQDEIELVEVIISEFQEKMKGGKKGKPGKGQNVSSKSASPAEVTMAPPIIVKALAEALGKRPNEVVSGLMMMNVLASINQSVDPDVAVEFAKKCGITLHIGSKAEAASAKADAEEIAPEDAAIAPGNPDDLKPRSPIVTFMGHVDHGKTSLQDRIRKTNVAGGEAGGITQNIGASVAQLNGKTITFVDTPGHEAFTQMRARGANVTDIVVLVVAADDGFMPQTIEALNHALAAKVPIIVAINKCDIPDADPDRVLLHMQQNGLTCEDWGGETAAIKVSAKTGEGIEDLLERILLEAEMLELKADPKRAGFAYVLESQLEQGFGPTAHIIVKSGTIKLGDPILCGEYYGKVKNLIDVHGQRIKSAGPATPVKIAGLSGVPEAGSRMVVCENEGIAKELAAKRADAKRQEELSSKATGGTTLEELFSKMDADAKKQLCVVLKGDVRGSVEAISESFTKLPNDKIAVNVVHSGVGAITENDVLLAKSSGGIVVGFHVRVNPGVNALAKKENVEIRLYSIIYELLEDIQDALAGRLEPEKREKILGDARILQIFELSKGPKICGCMVDKGSVKVGAKARVFRNNELIFNGEVRSLRRFHDDVKEVKQGLECGIKLDNFLDFEVGDHIQIYDVELKKATL